MSSNNDLTIILQRNNHATMAYTSNAKNKRLRHGSVAVKHKLLSMNIVERSGSPAPENGFLIRTSICHGSENGTDRTNIFDS